eukprot:TRINITY_DN41056_c0_g1_i1.p1 TRINITY_DN41056_c0_g1~~TRINITY_DN41056_c0_g1_i1.p1  ORF type:complete len:219 (-),score=42.86 TRINITY_DN41056_c0_g1_i1:104-760(-)
MVYFKGAQHTLSGTGEWKPVHLPGRRQSVQETNAERKTETLSRLQARRGSGAHAPKLDAPPQSSSELRECVLKQAFAMADRDGNGSINKMEFSLLMRRVSPQLSAKVIESHMRDVDTDKDGTISFDEFSHWLQQDAQALLAQGLEEEVGSQEGAMNTIFRLFDTDESGEISSDELKDMLNAICPSTKQADVDAILNVLDADKSGTVNFKEFVDFLYSK